MDKDFINRDSTPQWLMWGITGIFFILSIGGAWFFRQQRNEARHQTEVQLQTIASFKANEITQWRAARLHDAAVLAGDPFFLETAQAWMRSPDPMNRRKILDHFRTIQTQYSYWNILLTSPEGKNLLVLNGPSGGALGEIAAKSLAEALDNKRVVMTDLIPGAGPLPVRLNTIAPLILPSSREGVPFGALVLVSDVQTYLYPVIQSWPMYSTSAESLLVRRDGDSVLFLNELRNLKNTALNLRFPLTQTSLPAVMAVQGRKGVIEGVDYRGVKVFSALQPVAETTWYLVAKMDESEALAAWHNRSLMIIGLTISLFLAAVAMVWAVWQQRMKVSYRLNLETEKARRAAEQQYRTTLISIGDGVIVTDDKGMVALLNPVAENLTGWTQSDAQGNPVETIFNICNEDTRQKVNNPIQKVIESGRIVGLANHTILISRSGDEYPIMDSSAPIRDANGDLLGIVLVFRDQTAERNAERLLKTEHDNLEAILRASPVGLLVFDEAEHVITASPEAERLFNRKLVPGEHPRCEDFMSCWNQATYPEGCGESEPCPACSLNNAIRETLRTGKEVQNQEFTLERMINGNRERLSLSFGVAPVILEEHRNAVVVLQDISERRQVEINLKKSHDLLHEVGEAAKIGGWELDPNSMIGTWTDTLYQIFGVPLGQKPAIQDALLFYHPEDRPKISEALSKAIEKGEPFDLELRFITAEGKHLWVRALCKTVVENGKTTRLMGITQDVTRPKLASIDLKEKTEELERYFSTAMDLFCISNMNGNFIRLNQEWSNLFGYRIEELEGQSIYDFIHPDDLDSTRQTLSELHQQKPVLNFINRFRCHDGSWRWLEWRSFPKGELVYAAARNVTDRIIAEQRSERLAQQLQQAMKMEAIGRLAGGVAHDFNNLLTGIGGYTELLLSNLNPLDPMLEDLNEIKKATQSAVTLTSQLLAFSRKQLIEPKVLNLNDLVSGLRKMLQRLIGEDIELHTILHKELASAKVDPGQFEQILVNLAVNARDAMPDGGKLIIETANVDLDEDYQATHPYIKPGRHVMLAISDTGCGMSAEVKSHMFEPFYTTKQKGRGTGLGLATIYGTVKQSGGSIEVYSESEKGSIFRIYLPAIAENPEALEIDRSTSTSLPKGEETILLVEDERIVRELAAKLLKRLNYSILPASNGAEALEIARNYAGIIHLMITDVVMPGMNGRQLAEQLQQIRPQTKVLFTSGYTENAIAHHGIIDSNLNFIGKPYGSGDLARKIRRILD